MKKLNLMVHAGGSRVERAQIEKSATPRPTETWFPIPHARFLDGIQESVERSGLHVIEEAHALSEDQNKYFGLLQLANGKNPEDYSLILGLRNSHDKTFPAGLVVGSGVFVCDNLAFSGEIKISRKHTRHINDDLPALIDVAIGRLGDMRMKQDERIASYKAKEMTDLQAHDFLIQSIDAAVMPVTRIPDILKEWRTPRHPEFAVEKNAWRLFNAYTEVMKESNVFTRPRTTQALHGLMDTFCVVKN